MRLSLSLLLFARALTASYASHVPSNIWTRSEGTYLYTITPSDSADIAFIGDQLRVRYGPQNVATNQENGHVRSWTFTSSFSSHTSAIEAIEGIESVSHSMISSRRRAERTIPRELDNSLKHDTIEKTGEVSKRDMKRYNARAAEGSNVTETEAFLKTKVREPDKILQHKWFDEEVTGWYNLVLDDSALAEVKSHKGIDHVNIMQQFVDFCSLAYTKWPNYRPKEHKMEQKGGRLTRRADKWEKQEGADRALVMDSQYNGANLDTLTDFVHVPEPGKDTFIYIMDRGVKLDAVNAMGYEFHPPKGEHGEDPALFTVLQSKGSQSANQEPRVDESGHGTAVASKAVGTKYGVAKQATIIPVKFTNDLDDWQSALQLIVQDLRAHPGRERRSVVLTAAGVADYTQENVRNDPDLQRWYKGALQAILELGVPFICAAGNEEGKPIDSIPSLFQETDTPLVVVGSNEYDGSRSGFSQTGSQITIYAPGHDVLCQPLEDFAEGQGTGTSMSAPQVAGLIATYLSYDQKPWDDSKQGIERVKAIIDYLGTERSSWVRKVGSDIKIIWNGAGKDEHKNAGTSPAPAPAPAPVAHGPAAGKALSIILRSTLTVKPVASSSTYSNSWRFYTTTRGSLPLCNTGGAVLALKTDIKSSTKRLTDNPIWPEGTYALKIGNTDCEYKNDGKNDPGKLWCGGNAFDCFEEAMKTAQDGKRDCGGTDTEITERPIVHCEWAD